MVTTSIHIIKSKIKTMLFWAHSMIWVFYLSNQIGEVRYCSYEQYHLVFIDPINLGGRKMFKHLFIDPIR